MSNILSQKVTRLGYISLYSIIFTALAVVVLSTVGSIIWDFSTYQYEHRDYSTEVDQQWLHAEISSIPDADVRARVLRILSQKNEAGILLVRGAVREYIEDAQKLRSQSAAIHSLARR